MLEENANQSEGYDAVLIPSTDEYCSMAYAPPALDAVADSGHVVRPLEFWLLSSHVGLGVKPVCTSRWTCGCLASSRITQYTARDATCLNDRRLPPMPARPG